MRLFDSELKLTASQREDMLALWESIGPAREICFLDIETTGFSRLYDSVYLIGIAVYVDGAFHIKQFLAEELKDEGALLRRTLAVLTRYQKIVTYNGDMFDLPFLKERCYRFLRDPALAEALGRIESVDLFRQFRGYRSLFGWPDLKLKTVEASLGMERRDAFNGGQLIDVFHEYALTGDERLESLLLLHNYEDVQNLCGIVKVQAFAEDLKKGRAPEAELADDTLKVYWNLNFPLSLETKSKDGTLTFWFEAGSPLFAIRLSRASEPVKYYLPNPKDYYYLPETGEIVHKSLAFDVPSALRRTAKAPECFLLQKEGTFLRTPEPSEEVKSACQEQAITLPKIYRTSPKGETYMEAGELGRFIDKMNDENMSALNLYIHQMIDLIF